MTKIDDESLFNFYIGKTDEYKQMIMVQDQISLYLLTVIYRLMIIEKKNNKKKISDVYNLKFKTLPNNYMPRIKHDYSYIYIIFIFFDVMLYLRCYINFDMYFFLSI